MSRNGEKSRGDLYARITNRIIAELERGVRPWVQPWAAAGRITRPLRHNGQPSTGILWSEAVAHGFRSPIWMTFKQASELGAHVRKGETGSTVVYASRFTKMETDAHGDEVERDIPFLKAYTVFCADQIDGLPEHYCGRPTAVASTTIERNVHADAFFANTGAIVRHGGSMAFYASSSDYIQMPMIESFRDTASYVAVRAHETVHWTAPAHRVNRDLSRYRKDRSERAREELIAELGSCFLCADLAISPELEPRPDHASYLKSWLEVLSSEKHFIFSAAAHAQRAVAYLHDLQPKAADKAKLVRVENPTDKGPHFRIFAGNVELGAAWQKTAKDTERDYLSVKLDDPSFPAPIYATLIEVEGQEGLQLIWSRPSRD